MLKKIDVIMLSVLGGVMATSGYLNTGQGQPVSSELAVAEARALPDFGSIRDVRQKKQAFFDYMEPLIEQENQKLLVLRRQIRMLKERHQMTGSQQRWLMDMAEKYRINTGDQFDRALFNALLARIDIIPVSLALAQSANESAWGTSRFAVEGNNLFGQWCFSKGCGLVPARRPAGAGYEVRKFAAVSESVRAYLFNLNTHPEYQEMRDIRLTQRETGEPLLGSALAKGLRAYSTRGTDYIKELVGMIASNNLIRYDLEEQAPNS